jgi:hypothetical protein
LRQIKIPIFFAAGRHQSPAFPQSPPPEWTDLSRRNVDADPAEKVPSAAD